MNSKTEPLKTMVSVRYCMRNKNNLVLQGGIMKDEQCMLRGCLNGGLSLSCLVIAIFSLVILDIMTGRAHLRLSSRQFKCCSMSPTLQMCSFLLLSRGLHQSPTLDVFHCLLVTIFAALHWNISIYRLRIFGNPVIVQLFNVLANNSWGKVEKYEHLKLSVSTQCLCQIR